MSLNKVILIGNITKDLKKTQLPSGGSVIRFTLAVDRNYTGKDGNRPTDFINIVAWDKLAEIIEQHTSKGHLIAVEGRLQTRKYQDNDGKNVYVTEVVADDVYFLSKPEGKGQKEATEAESYETDEFSFDEGFEPILNKEIF